VEGFTLKRGDGLCRLSYWLHRDRPSRSAGAHGGRQFFLCAAAHQTGLVRPRLSIDSDQPEDVVLRTAVEALADSLTARVFSCAEPSRPMVPRPDVGVRPPRLAAFSGLAGGHDAGGALAANPTEHCGPPRSRWSGSYMIQDRNVGFERLPPQARRVGIADRRPPRMPGPARYAKPPRLAALNRTANAGHQSKLHPRPRPDRAHYRPPHSIGRAGCMVPYRGDGLNRLLPRPDPNETIRRGWRRLVDSRADTMLEERSRPSPTEHIPDRLTPVGRAGCMVGFLDRESRDHCRDDDSSDS
jgi:hypothetical protein